jgi:hypothetical protein
LFSTFIVRCNATAIVYYSLVRMIVFDGKAIYIIAIFRYFVIIILYCKTIHPVIFFQQQSHNLCTINKMLDKWIYDTVNRKFNCLGAMIF